MTTARQNILSSIKKRREEVEKFKPDVAAPHAKAIFKTVQLELHDGHQVTLDISRPSSSPEGHKFPTIINVPGTAFIFNNRYFTEMITSQIAEMSGCQVITLNPRLAPEFPFPTPVFDICEMMLRVLEHSEALCIDQSKMLLYGQSSGGGLAVTLARFMQKLNKPFEHIIILMPLLDFSGQTAMPEMENQDKCLPAHFIPMIKKYYLSKKVKLDNPLLSPCFSKDFKGFARTEIITGERDRFRGHSQFFHQKLLENDVSATLTVVPNEDHFGTWFNFSIFSHIAKMAKCINRMESVPRSLPESECRGQEKDHHSTRL